MQDAAGSVGRVYVIRRCLVAKPKWSPGAVLKLRLQQIGYSLLHRIPDALPQRRLAGTYPANPGSKGVGGEVWAAPVKIEVAPPMTERWDPAVAILQIEQPLQAVGHPFFE